MCINHRRLHILVSQELLNGPDIVALLKQMRCKAVPKSVAADTLSRGQVSFVETFDTHKIPLEGRDQATGKHCHSIFHPFAVSHDDLALGKIYIFDPQAQTFHQSQSTTKEQFNHEPVDRR
jgi:hypothetical protein